MILKSLQEVITEIDKHKGPWQNAQLVQDVKMFLWATYDPDDDLTYPTIDNWGDILASAIENNSYSTLVGDEVLSILFGLIHRDRIAGGLWLSMFERGITRQLLGRLLSIDS